MTDSQLSDNRIDQEMKIAMTYSHLNGLEYLLVRKPEHWSEIQTVIAQVDIDKCRRTAFGEIKMANKPIISTIDMHLEFCRLFYQKSWHDSHVSAGLQSNEVPSFNSSIASINGQEDEFETASNRSNTDDYQTSFMKDRVAVEVQLGNDAYDVTDLFARHLAFYVGDRIDVGVEILPMKTLQSQMSSGVAYYEGEFYNIIRQGRGVPAAPLALIGVEP